MPERLREIHEETGRRVSVIGWSAGGILGREAARRNPDAVRQVITMGSPFRLLLDDRYKTHAALLYRMTERWHITPTDSMLRAEHCEPLLQVPVTSIYSRTDGVASWQTCVEDDGPRTREHRGVREPLRARPQPGDAASRSPTASRNPRARGRRSRPRAGCTTCTRARRASTPRRR